MKFQLGNQLRKFISIFDDDISFFAASLSFYSALSIIPMLWVLFFMLNYFGVVDNYYQLIKEFLVESLIPTHAELIVSYIEAFLANAKRMGVVGLVYILVTSALFYKNYQYAVNKIFLVPNHSLLHGIATYLLLAVLMPMTLAVSVYLSDYIQRVVGVENMLLGKFTLLSYLLIWMLFFVLFKISPNMRISIRIALKVSFVASIVWHLGKWLFIQYLLVNQTYTSLYGSFSALLLLLIWIYVSWLILLQGLRICYLMHCHRW